MLRALLLISGVLAQALMAETAGACVPVVDDQGRIYVPIVDAGGSMFVGTLVGVRAPDFREIDQLRARWDFNPARRAESDEKVIERFSRFTWIAEFAVQQDSDTAERPTRTIWFEDTGNCPGPFNEGLPLDIGQTVVVFSRTVEGVPMGWIPDVVSVEMTGSQQAINALKRLIEQSDRCPERLQLSRRYSVVTTYLRAPESGFGRGCVAETH